MPHFVQKMKKNTLKDSLDAKKDAKRDAKSSFCCSEYLLLKYEHPIVINCDNTSAINMSKNPTMHSKTKHIPIKYHYLREQVSQKSIGLEYIDTKEQIVDIFTKPLPKEAFEHIRQKMGVIPLQKY